ncbi:hypothetical protein D3C85_1401240 [compost metagenome]
MKAWSSTGAERAAVAASSASISHLHMPVIAAISPPLRTCRYWVLIAVSAGVSICTGDCGLAKCTRPTSLSGLKVTMGTSRWRASRSWCSMRGLLTPTFWPKKKMASVRSKSSSRTVPTGTPMASGSATEVLSWHMLELSGKLLLPYSRASNWYM